MKVWDGINAYGDSSPENLTVMCSLVLENLCSFRERKKIREWGKIENSTRCVFIFQNRYLMMLNNSSKFVSYFKFSSPAQSASMSANSRDGE